MPEFQKFFTDAERQQGIADALMQRSMQSRVPQQQGRITPKMGIASAVSPLVEAMLARRAGGKASDLREQGEEARRQAQAAALSGMGGGLTPTDDPMLAAGGMANTLDGGGSKQPQNPFMQAQNMLEAGVDQSIVGSWLQSQQPQEADSTDDITEYEFARQQGYEGSFQDFLMDPRRRGGTTVNLRNMGTIPPGFRAEYDDQGNPTRLVPIPGGPAAQEAAAAEEAAANRQQGKEMQGGIVAEEIDRALATLESPSLPETGLVGNLLKGVPGTDSHAMANNLQTIKANIGFDKLQAMREASPTGGALGQVSEREIDFLQSVLGSLAQSQRKEDIVYNLNRLWNTYQDIIHGPGNGPERRPLTPTQGAPQAQQSGAAPQRFTYDPTTGQLVPQ